MMAKIFHSFPYRKGLDIHIPEKSERLQIGVPPNRSRNTFESRNRFQK